MRILFKNKNKKVKTFLRLWSTVPMTSCRYPTPTDCLWWNPVSMRRLTDRPTSGRQYLETMVIRSTFCDDSGEQRTLHDS